MSILDTFLILFRSNAKDTEKDIDSLGKKTKQTQENIDKTDKSTRQLGLTFDDFVKALVTASGIDLSIKGLASATKNVADMEVGLGRLSKLTGIGASDIDAWDQALQRFGAPAGAFESWLSSVNSQYQAHRPGGQGQEYPAEYHSAGRQVERPEHLSEGILRPAVRPDGRHGPGLR